MAIWDVDSLKGLLEFLMLNAFAVALSKPILVSIISLRWRSCGFAQRSPEQDVPLPRFFDAGSYRCVDAVI